MILRASDAGRAFDQGSRTNRPGIDAALSSPRTLLKRMTIDCVTLDIDALRLAEKVVGADRVPFGPGNPAPARFRGRK